LNLITLHLGNGASATAIEGGRSVDTSMGMTPLEGLAMGTRCGDLDPAIPLLVARRGSDADALLNEQSGMRGLCGTSDMREVLRRNDAEARLALEIYCYRIRKYIGAYFAVLGRVDALVFTAGVGENSHEVRRRACDGLFGIRLGPGEGSGARAVHAPGSVLPVLVIPTNEEVEIARQTVECVRAAGGGRE
jgi:acetate kinase